MQFAQYIEIEDEEHFIAECQMKFHECQIIFIMYINIIWNISQK